MDPIAFILAFVAVILFLVDFFRPVRFIALGLAFLAASWICQCIQLTGHLWMVN